MQFTRVGNLFKVARITGPSHNLLGIEFRERTDPPSDDVGVEVVPAETDRTFLSSSEVRREVLLGVADANEEFGTDFVVKRIEFSPTDSPPAETYRFLARTIVDRLAKHQSFGLA